ncbi:MAG: response regulator [Pseudomonadota bacterium]
MTDTNDKRLRIAIGENHTDLAESLSLLVDLQPDMQCVGHAASSSGLLALAADESPDLFILDLSLDDGSSIPLMKTLRARLPHCAIIAFTGLTSEVLVEQCLLAGCDRVLAKAGPIDGLLAALRGAAAQRSAQSRSRGGTS